MSKAVWVWLFLFMVCDFYVFVFCTLFTIFVIKIDKNRKYERRRTRINAWHGFWLMLATQAFVYLSKRYSGHVEGLCGNFDGDSNDDFAIMDNPSLFAARWKTSTSCPESRLPDDYQPCRVRLDHQQININPLTGILNRTATDHYTAVWWLVHWPLMVGCYIWYSEEGTGRDAAQPTHQRSVY